jgi:ribosome maturation protein SDO1
VVSLDKAMVAHIKKDGEQFEIMVEPDLALLYKKGEKKDLNNILAVEEVFKDAKKGERHKSSALQKAFKTEDIFQISEIILKEGTLSLTTDQRRRMLEEKKKQIAALIAREAIDPRTGAPHTLLRIEQAMEKARLDIDPLKEAQQQVDGVLAVLKPILPIKMHIRKVAIKIPPQYAQQTYGMLKNHGIEKEQWASDGSLIAVVKIPAGLTSEFYDRLNKSTAGAAETRLLDE